MNDKLQEIVNEASIRTTIFEDTYIVELRKESFDYLVEQAEKAEELQEKIDAVRGKWNSLWNNTDRLLKTLLNERKEIEPIISDLENRIANQQKEIEWLKYQLAGDHE